MEGMNLAKLEAVVKKMLSNLQELKRENAALQVQLEAKGDKLAELESKIKSMTSSQEEVSSRVTSLLSSIEEWERKADLDSPVEQVDSRQEDHDEEEVVESRGGGLFSLGE